MAFRLSLPFGHPASSLSINEKITYLEGLKNAVSLESSGFTPTTPFRSFQFDFSMPATDQHSKLYALWDGVVSAVEGNFWVLQMSPSLNKFLKNKYYKEYPIPKYAVYGPLADPTILQSRVMESGALMGTLRTLSTFRIELRDDNLYRLDPLFYFQLFKEEGLWDLPINAVNPLLPSFTIQTLSIAGPKTLGHNQAYLKISGGGRGTEVMNPGPSVDPKYYSFLSKDTIRIEVGNLGEEAELLFRDISRRMYKTQNNPPEIKKQGTEGWEIVPEEVLKPTHLPYKKGKYVGEGDNRHWDDGNGKKTPGVPLQYRIEVKHLGGNLNTEISQDIKDVIRQEYLFHSPPFQTDKIVLDIPPRDEIQFNNEVPGHFTKEQIQKSNYGKEKDNWVLNAKETLHVLEYIRAVYKNNVIKNKKTHPEEYKKVRTFDLTVNSSWRNPERNEAVGGARKSNHQFGKAIDIKSPHRGKSIDNNKDNVGAFFSLFQAGRTFLEKLVALNGAEKTTEVEIFLERPGAQIFWQLIVNKNSGLIESVKGNNPSYEKVVGGVPINTVDAIKKAARYASHVHISWNALSTSESLKLPSLEEIEEPPKGVPFKNIILIATEDKAVPAEDQLPINFAAKSLARHLKVVTPDIPTEVIEVSNAIEFLKPCNAFKEPEYQIKYFFSFSHAWEYGLGLKHYPDSADPDFDSPEAIAFLKEINLIYGTPPDPEAGEESEETSTAEPRLKYGPDDFREIKPHQIRVSNLYHLPTTYRDRMRFTFQDAAGVFLVGCNTANEDTGPRSNFSEVFSALIQKPVYGAFYYSFFYRRNEDGVWETVEINRLTDPTDRRYDQVILVPGRYGSRSLLAYLKKYGDWQLLPLPPLLPIPTSLPPLHIPDIPPIPDLIAIYKTMLTRENPIYLINNP